MLLHEGGSGGSTAGHACEWLGLEIQRTLPAGKYGSAGKRPKRLRTGKNVVSQLVIRFKTP